MRPGKKDIHIWVDEKLFKKMENKRGDVPRNTYLVRLIEKDTKYVKKN